MSTLRVDCHSIVLLVSHVPLSFLKIVSFVCISCSLRFLFYCFFLKYFKLTADSFAFDCSVNISRTVKIFLRVRSFGEYAALSKDSISFVSFVSISHILRSISHLLNT